MASLRPCESCGEPLGDVRASRKRHPACAKKFRNAQTVALARKKREAKKQPRACGSCEASIDHRAGGAKFCEDCARRREYAITARWIAEHRPPAGGRDCQTCGVPIAGRRSNARFCVSCSRQRALDRVSANRASRRSQGWGFHRDAVFRAHIFKRDGYTCHICGDPTSSVYSAADPLSPVIDHLIPLVLPESPGHVPENTACAHRYCNQSKGARVRQEDWDLYHRLCRESTERTA